MVRFIITKRNTSVNNFQSICHITKEQEHFHNMETFYITYDQFWDWFNREDDPPTRQLASPPQQQSSSKRLKKDHPRVITEPTNDKYIIMYCRHKPGKKHKVWEGDGYLSLSGRTAYITDLRGRLMEDPTCLDDIDFDIVKDLGELTIGNLDVQVVEKK